MLQVEGLKLLARLKVLMFFILSSLIIFSYIKPDEENNLHKKPSLLFSKTLSTNTEMNINFHGHPNVDADGSVIAYDIHLERKSSPTTHIVKKIIKPNYKMSLESSSTYLLEKHCFILNIDVLKKAQFINLKKMLKNKVMQPSDVPESSIKDLATQKVKNKNRSNEYTWRKF